MSDLFWLTHEQMERLRPFSPKATKGGMNTKLHAVADANGRPLSFFMAAGQVSDYTGAAALLDDLPKAQCLPGTAAMTPTGSGMPSRPRESTPAPRVGIPQRARQVRQASLQAPRPHRDPVCVAAVVGTISQISLLIRGQWQAWPLGPDERQSGFPEPQGGQRYGSRYGRSISRKRSCVRQRAGDREMNASSQRRQTKQAGPMI
jgi:hypothetical protein